MTRITRIYTAKDRKKSVSVFNSKLKTQHSTFLLAVLLPLAGILPMLRDGIIRTADGQAHLHRFVAMTLLMRQGDLWPRWIPYLHLGYGYPLFNFYPPGVHWLGGLLGLLGISAPVAFNLILAAAWIGGTLGIFALAKRLLPVRAALLAAMLWAYALPRLQEVWSQGSLSQMTAVACVPWLALGILLTARQPSRRHAVVIALPLAGILLCHLPTAVLSALFAGPVIAFLVLAPARTQPRQARARLFGLGGGLLLGVGLAAIFLLPMVAELRYVSAATSSGADYLADNFLQLSDFFIQPRLLDVTDTRLVIAPTLGLVPGLLALAGLGGLLVRRRFGLAALLALGIAAMLLLAQAISTPLWLSVPFMSQLRFPWRSLYVGGLFAALAGGAALLLLPARWRTAGLLIGLLGVLGAALPWTYPARESLHWDRLTAADEIQVELDDHLWGLSSYDEFQPVWGASVPLDAPDVAAYADAPLRIGLYSLDLIRAYPDLQAEQLDDTTVRVTLTAPRPVRFRQYYYPGWTATLDGQPIEVYPEDEIGLITLDVPAGEHVIALHYAGTPVQAAGVLVTLGCLVLGAALIWTGRRQAVPDARPEDPPLDLRLVGALGAGVVLFAAIYAWVIIPHTDWLRLKSRRTRPSPCRRRSGRPSAACTPSWATAWTRIRLPRRRAGRHALLAVGGRAGWAHLPARGPARGPESQRGVGRQPGQWRALPGHPAGPLPVRQGAGHAVRGDSAVRGTDQGPGGGRGQRHGPAPAGRQRLPAAGPAGARAGQ